MADILSFFPFLQGVPYGDTVAAAIIVIAALAVAKLFYFAFHRGIKKMTARTQTHLDDIVVDVLEKPVYLGILIVGLFFASLTVEFLTAFRDQTNLAFTIIAILWAAFFAARIINAIIKWYATNVALKTKTKIDDSVMPIIRRILQVFVYAIALIVILHRLGVEVTPLVASLGIAGLAVALALQDTLSNLFAGTYLVGDKTVKVGDYIEIDLGGSEPVEGYIDYVGWRSMRIRTTYSNVTDNIVIIPNAKVAQSVITNYSYPNERTLLIIPVGVAYGSDLEKVEKITVDTVKKLVKKNDGCTKDFEPFVRFKNFGDSNINLDIVLKVEHARNRTPVRHEIIKEIKAAYDKNRIEISWPVRKVYIHDETKRKKR